MTKRVNKTERHIEIVVFGGDTSCSPWHGVIPRYAECGISAETWSAVAVQSLLPDKHFQVLQMLHLHVPKTETQFSSYCHLKEMPAYTDRRKPST